MDILEYFRLPEKAKINQRIYVKDFIQFAEITGSIKSLIEKSINTIHLVGIINEDTSGIWKYEDESYSYNEIQLFVINLKDDSKIKQLNEEIQKSLPNPTVVVYKYFDKYLISTALKRNNKLEKNKSVIDSIETTSWFKLDNNHIELLSKYNYQKKNLKELYELIDCIVCAEFVALITNNVPEIIDYTVKEKSIKIQELLQEKNSLIQQENEESSMQGKMQCHMRIKEIEDELKKIG